MVSKHSAVRSIRLPNEVWDWLSTEAEKRGTTVNGLVAEGVALVRATYSKAAPELRDGPDADYVSGTHWGPDAVAKAKARTVEGARPALVLNRIEVALQVGPTERKPGALLKQKGTKK